jgi:MoxR-like ATPase
MTTPAEQLYGHLAKTVGAHVFGMQEAVHQLCVAVLARGHVLVEGVPGLGKTLLARTTAHALGGNFKRVQCTADLMPSDITGVHVYRTGTEGFELVPGPIFADVVLVDEINRTGPKTQSALLEAMEERTVTIDRETYALPEGFFVLASQNPHEFEGTYPLPESQLDRFLLRLKLDYPPRDAELAVLRAYDRPASNTHAGAVEAIDADLVERAREQDEAIHVADAIHDYVHRIAQATRNDARLSPGLSTRGMVVLVRCARVAAALRGGDYVTPDDVKRTAPGVIAHRLILTPEAQIEGTTADEITAGLLDEVEIPR